MSTPSVLLFFYLILNFSTAHARRSAYWAPSHVMNAKSFGLEFLGSHFITSSTIDASGNEMSLADGDSFTKSEAEVLLRYGFNFKFELNGGLRFRRNESILNEVTKTAEGLESYSFGAKYLFPRQGRWQFSTFGQVLLTAYENPNFDSSDLTNSEIALGDSGTWYELGLSGTFLFSKNWNFSGQFAFRQPPQDMSQEIPYLLEAALIFDSLAFVAGLEGIYSLGNDAFSANPNDKPALHAAATELFNSVDREFLRPYMRIQIKLGQRWVVGGAVKQVVAGNSTDKGTEFALSLSYWKEGETKDQLKVKQFKEYEVEASVIKVSPRGSFVKIDKGLADDIDKGMVFDIYEFDYLGGNVLVATGYVYESDSDTSIVRIQKRYRSIPVKVGFVARGKQR